MLLDLSQELPPLTAEEIYEAFFNSLRFREGFGIIFLQCSPASANQLIPRVQQELPDRNIEVLELVEPIDNLYRLVEARADRASLNILFVRGLEKSLESDIKPGYKGLGDYYNLNTVPPVLSHLNQQRENFRDHFGNLCFVFVLPQFAIRYFVRRAPDFYDWNSGVFKIEGLLPYPLQLNDSSWISFRQQILEKGIEHYHQDQSVTDSERYQDWSKQGDYLYDSHRYEEAIASYDRAVAIKPNDYQSWYKRGVALGNLGRYEESINSYDRAVTIKPDDHQSWYNRGLSLSNLGKYEEAIESYDRVLAIKSHLNIAWVNRGISQGCLGRYKESINSFDRAISIKPDLHIAWFNRGISHGHLGEYEEAIKSYDQAIFIKPDFYGAWNNRGNCLNELGRYEEAINSFDQTTIIQPNLFDAWHNKGCTYAEWGKYPESISCFDQAIIIRPNEYSSWHEKGLIFFITNNYQVALDTWQQAFYYISDPKVPRYYDFSKLIQEFIEELISRFTQPSIQETLLIPLLEIYQQANVITELGAALVNTLHLIVAPTISDHTAAEWLSLWRTSSLSNESAMEMPLRLMSTAIEYKKDPSKRQRLWLNLPSEEHPILNKALKLSD